MGAIVGSGRAFELPELPGAPPRMLEVRQYAQTTFSALSLELPSQPPDISALPAPAPTSRARPPAASSATTAEYLQRRLSTLDPTWDRLQDAHRTVGNHARAAGERVGAMVAARDRTYEQVNRMFIAARFIAARNDGRWPPALAVPLIDHTIGEVKELQDKAAVLRAQLRQTAEAIATTDVPSLLDKTIPPITNRGDRIIYGWSPEYEERVREFIREVPPEGPNGYGNIPAGISGLLEHIYSNPGPGRSATSVGAMIGLDHDASNPGSQYAPYAIAHLLPGLAQRSNVRTLLLTDFQPHEQAAIDGMNEDDLGTYLRNKFGLPADLPANAPEAGLTDGMAHLIIAARKDNIDVVAYGAESIYPDDSKLPLIQGRHDAIMSGRGNYLVVGRDTETHPAGLDSILGIPSIDVYNPNEHEYYGSDAFFGVGRPLDIRPGEIHYNIFDIATHPRSTAIWHPLLPTS